MDCGERVADVPCAVMARSFLSTSAVSNQPKNCMNSCRMWKHGFVRCSVECGRKNAMVAVLQKPAERVRNFPHVANVLRLRSPSRKKTMPGQKRRRNAASLNHNLLPGNLHPDLQHARRHRAAEPVFIDPADNTVSERVCGRKYVEAKARGWCGRSVRSKRAKKKRTTRPRIIGSSRKRTAKRQPSGCGTCVLDPADNTVSERVCGRAYIDAKARGWCR